MGAAYAQIAQEDGGCSRAAHFYMCISCTQITIELLTCASAYAAHKTFTVEVKVSCTLSVGPFFILFFALKLKDAYGVKSA